MGMLQGFIRNTQRKAVLFHPALYHRKCTIGTGGFMAEGSAEESIPNGQGSVPTRCKADACRSYTTDWEEVGPLSLVNISGLCYSNLVNEPRFPTLLLLLPVENLRRVHTLVSDL
jgi:hypothetical protein